jgi:Zn-dependent M32 family carboxypeptidase
MLRFDFELDLLEGKLVEGSARGFWRAHCLKDLGVPPRMTPTALLRDMHWWTSTSAALSRATRLGTS